MPVYSGIYEDRAGREDIHFASDGHELRTTLRGVDFAGGSFDGLSAGDPQAARAQGLALNGDELCDCTIHCAIPVAVGRDHPDLEDIAAVLQAATTLGKPAAHGGIDQLRLELILRYDDPAGTAFARKARCDGDFEEALESLRKKMPTGYFLRICYNCDLSDYFYAGRGSFGELICFRNRATEYLRVTDKLSYMNLFDGRHHEFVQETHLCSQYKRRQPDRGYRG